MPESVVEERSDSTTVGAVEVYDSEVDSFNSRVNGKAIGNGNALTATAKRVQYGVRITPFYNLLLHHVPRDHFVIGKYTLHHDLEGPRLMDPEGDGVVVSPHLIGCEH